MGEPRVEITGGAKASIRRPPRAHGLRWRIGLPVVLAIACVGGAVWASGGGDTLPQDGLIPSSSALQSMLAGLPQRGFVLGKPSAPVTVTEFADLQCPYCDGFALAVFPRLVSRYVRPGKVKFVFRNLPILGADSIRAAETATAAAHQNKLWQFIESFYYFQRPENTGYVKGPFLQMVASNVKGLRIPRLLGESASPGIKAELIAALRRDLAQGLHSTPTFVITAAGHTPVRVVGYNPLTSQLDQALAR